MERDYPPTGGPRRLSEILPATLVLIQTSPQTSLPTTGTASLAPPDARSIGLRPGGTGVAATPRSPLAAFDLGPTVAAQRLAPLLAPHIVWGERTTFSERGFEGVQLVDVAARSEPPPLARSLLEEILAPCGARFAASKLAELRALTASRARDGEDIAAMASAYTVRLAEYPADVVMAACHAWADRETFWPAWADLKAECDKRMRGRLKIKAAIGA